MNSRWFHESEMACHDGTPYPMAWGDRLTALFSQLDIIRGNWAGPIRIVSGYRTPEYNAHVSGAKLSQHMQGLAADIAPMVSQGVMHASVADLHGRIMRLMSSVLTLVGGVGYYAGKWVHVDIRPHAGHIAQWEGTGIGSEAA